MINLQFFRKEPFIAYLAFIFPIFIFFLRKKFPLVINSKKTLVIHTDALDNRLNYVFNFNSLVRELRVVAF